MKFTYGSYQRLLQSLNENGYIITDYDSSVNINERHAILRHDVDFDLELALDFAKLEALCGVSSTYFVLLSSNFYNLVNGNSIAMLKEISSLGHKIGLHFDEKNYPDISKDTFVYFVEKELHILENLVSEIGIKINSVSMHRPSEETLNADYDFGNVVNSYSKRFFNEYKYISDSRMNWREDVFSIIESGQYDCLHILTHPFWYAESEEPTREKLLTFIGHASLERYDTLSDNFRNLNEFVKRGEIEI